MKQSTDLKLHRQWYAGELRSVADLQSERLVKAFATVPREDFLGPGPWHIIGEQQLVWEYVRTSDADPRHLYHNVLVAIDAGRGLNNGAPALLAALIDQLSLREGETAYHVGCGTGYYSAIMAEVVGKGGRVIALEIDETLARRARSNLEAYPNVEVVNADGFAHNPGYVDAILVNAGVTHLSQVWLKELKPKGRLVVPLTTTNGRGTILKAIQNKPNWDARLLSHLGIYHCVGGRSGSAEHLLTEAFTKGGAEEVRLLRLDEHEGNRDCWLHGSGFCLSRRSAMVT
jgi:protein-L-isoaspartate(D-aspartate) O-methyltransferase